MPGSVASENADGTTTVTVTGISNGNTVTQTHTLVETGRSGYGAKALCPNPPPPQQ
jgi:hypothetical protein